ncbi:TPA: hypothetical protein ACS705_003414 [Providencia alcalifaciens]
MSIIKHIFILLTSLLISFSSYSDTYYGVLRGDRTIHYKSVFSGIVNVNEDSEGSVFENMQLFNVKSYEYESKMDILNLKLSSEKVKLKRALQDKTIGDSSFKKGFISKGEVDSINDKITDININIKEIESNINGLKKLSMLNSPLIKGKYIIRDIYVSNEQYVNSGDDIMKVETLDKYYIDIKIDPASIKGNLKNKIIKYKSLVNSSSGYAVVEKISKSNIDDGIYGMKLVSLSLDIDKQVDFSELLDTTFEITIND